MEEQQVSSNQLAATLKRILREGNVRRIVVRNASGRTVLDVPLAAGLVGAALLPFWAAVGGLAALAARYTVIVERAESSEPKPPAVH